MYIQASEDISSFVLMRGSCGVLNLGLLVNIWFAHWALKSCFLPGFRTFVGREMVRCSGSVLLYSGVFGRRGMLEFSATSSCPLIFFGTETLSCGLQQLLLLEGICSYLQKV